MKILIELEPQILDILKKKAKEQNHSRKSYIELILIKEALKSNKGLKEQILVIE